ncbi:hypothetical protein KQX54_008010 [Cotesia glomerata]|uniref:Uncharacterized protein n=1 Tax=Cotesia glomerata TaxID=32391 RepID=A0AAV7J3L4_COTGL|nr:hypothetical protein KQX54_008010 [Cotesia glomerata]
MHPMHGTSCYAIEDAARASGVSEACAVCSSDVGGAALSIAGPGPWPASLSSPSLTLLPKITNHQSIQQHLNHHETQGIQQNSVLVYVPGENFAYATAVGHNAASSGYQTAQQQQHHHSHQQQQQQQNPYSNVLPQVATQAIFSAKTNYNIGNSELVESEIDQNADCCLGKSIELVACNVVADQQQQQQQIKNEEDYNSTIYRNPLVGLASRATGSPNNVGKIDLGALTNSIPGSSAISPGQSDADSLSGTSDSGVVATATAASRSALPSSSAALSGDLEQTKTFLTGQQYEVTCNTTGGYSSSGVATENYQSSNAGNETGIAGTLDDGARLTYVRSSNNLGGGPVSNIFISGIDSQQQQQRDLSKSARVNQDLLDVNRTCISGNSVGAGSAGGGGGVIVVSPDPGCESVRSDTAESVYSSSLSSPDCQSLQSNDSVNNNSNSCSSSSNSNSNSSSSVVCVQQAAQFVSNQVVINNNNNAQHSSNVALTMNCSVVVQHQQKQQQQQQQQQQQASIAVPRGWKRICTNGVIIYIR